MKLIVGARNCVSPTFIWEFMAVAGNGFLTIGKKTPLSYEMKSIAVLVLKKKKLNPGV